MKSLIFLTTSTSATGSMQRIIKRALGGKLTRLAYFDKLRELPRSDIIASVPPENGYFLLLNSPPLFNRSLDLAKYRFIVNFRDPRDRVCNLYHWQLVHPRLGETEEARAARIARVKELGINRWVGRTCRSGRWSGYYDNIFWLLENAPEPDCIVLSYARLCCDFDSYIEKLAEFLGERMDEERRSALEVERVENLAANSGWIGNSWSGSDTCPGRYKRELDSRRIEIVTRCFEPELRQLAKYDPDFAEQYLEGLT